MMFLLTSNIKRSHYLTCFSMKYDLTHFDNMSYVIITQNKTRIQNKVVVFLFIIVSAKTWSIDTQAIAHHYYLTRQSLVVKVLLWTDCKWPLDPSILKQSTISRSLKAWEAGKPITQVLYF